MSLSLFDPPVAFHFNVVFLGLIPPVPDMAFQEVSGLEVELETEPMPIGGENQFVRQVPKSTKHPNLVLKRGLTTLASGLVLWCKSTIEDGIENGIKPKTIVISLLNQISMPVANWTLSDAYPIKWSVGGFDAMKNELAVETIEFTYTTLVRDV